MNIELNKNEKIVLNAIVESIIECTDDDFTFFDDLVTMMTSFTTNQLKGYVSSLCKKGLIICDSERNNMILLKSLAVNFTNKDVSDFVLY